MVWSSKIPDLNFLNQSAITWGAGRQRDLINPQNNCEMVPNEWTYFTVMSSFYLEMFMFFIEGGSGFSTILIVVKSFCVSGTSQHNKTLCRIHHIDFKHEAESL